MPKATRTAEQLQGSLIERIETIPYLRGQVADVHRAHVVGTGVNGEGGPSWTAPALADRGTYGADISRILGERRMRIDLDK